MQKTDSLLMTTMKNLGDDYGPTFVRSALKQAIQKLLVSIMDDEDVKKAVESAIMQMATKTAVLRGIAMAPVTGEAMTAPVTKSVASQAWKEAIKAVQQYIAIALTF